MDKFYFPNNIDLFPSKLTINEENKLSIALSIFPIVKISTYLNINLENDIKKFAGNIKNIVDNDNLLDKLVQIGNTLGIYVEDNEDNIVTNPWIKTSKINLKTLLKENQIQLQKIFFERKKNIVITGGTGVGKTSQVPKLLWYYNSLFDGFNCFEKEVNIEDINQLLNLELDLKNELINFRDVTLMFPRKQLIISSYENMAESLGDISIFNLLYRDSKIKNNSILKFNFIVPKLGSKVADSTSIAIFDEIHEHDGPMDTMISIYYKSNLKLKLRNFILMSATIDDDRKDFDVFFNKNWSNFHIRGERQFPVKEVIIPGNYLDLIEYRLPKRGEAGILFFSSVSKVLEAVEILKEKYLNNLVIFPIYSKNSLNNEYIKETENIKDKPIILVSTPILESSITVRNATIVYDTSEFYLSKMYFSGANYRITSSMYEQRKGRVGRVSPGLYLCNSKIFSNVRKIDVTPLAPFIFEFSKFKLDYTNLFQRPLDPTRWFKTKAWFIKEGGMNIRSLYKYYNALGDTNFDPLLLLKVKENHNKDIRRYLNGKKVDEDKLFVLAKLLNFSGTLINEKKDKNNKIKATYKLNKPVDPIEKTITVEVDRSSKTIFILDINKYYYK